LTGQQNAGALATVGFGTALGVIRAAVRQGKRLEVYASETRPRLQGARLTAFELKREGIPVTVITDNMVGYLMAKNMVDKVIVGADRVLAKTGHVVNKIGTLSLAVNAHHFNVPFHVAAPISSIDLDKTPEEVVIEERDEAEVHYVGRTRVTPRGVRVINPAFDITPPTLVTSVITERGVFAPTELIKLLVG